MAYEQHDDDTTALTAAPAVHAGGAPPKKGARSGLVIASLVFVVAAALAVVVIFTISRKHGSTVSNDVMNARAQCVQEHLPNTLPQEGRGQKALGAVPEYRLLRHATLLTGHQATYDREALMEDVDILIKGSKIEAVGKDLAAPAGAVITDLGLLTVTPGIVDMHSHAGVYGWPEVWAREDGNEMTNPVTPMVRAIDGYMPKDTAIPLILEGGVTTSQILPGSGNNMGGEGFIVKMRGNSVRDFYVEDSPRLLKFACGENPKRVYGRGRRVTPMSRMGNTWVMRQKLEAARKLVQSQHEWCEDPEHHHEAEEEHEEHFDSSVDNSPFPTDLSLNSLAALLRGDARLHVHCYEIEDLEMMLRMSREFNFTISAFHHALQAYRIADQMKEAGVTIATFSDLTWYKMEAWDASTRSPKVLHDAGVPVALKSDHPVLFAGDLMYEAAKAHYYGLPRHAAIAAITSIPAKAIGMYDRVGSLEAGKDADLVVWNKDPLELGAMPAQVYVNGELLVDKTLPAAGSSSQDSVTVTPSGPTACQAMPKAMMAVTGVTVHSQDATIGTATNQNIIVMNGDVSCVGDDTACPVPPGADVYAMPGAHATPGFIESLSRIGLIEISAESSTNDGYITGNGQSGSSAEVMALDGVRMNTRHVWSAFAAGITTSVTHPMGSQLLSGLSVAYYTSGRTIGDSLVHPHAALNINVGDHAKDGGLTNSISGQFSALRQMFRGVNGSLSYTTSPQDVIAMAKRKSIKVVVHVDQADAIAAALRFQRHCECDMVIAGAAEAHILADKIAAQDVGVVVKARVRPNNFQRLRVAADGLMQLKASGVRAALAVGDEDNARNLRWEAGVLQSMGMSFEDALASITTDVAEVFGLGSSAGKIQVGKKANFVVFDGQPLSISAHPRLVVLGDKATCDPEQR